MAQIQWSLWVKWRNEAASRTAGRWTSASLAFAETSPVCLSKLLCGLSLLFTRLDTPDDVHAAEQFMRAQNVNCNLHTHTLNPCPEQTIVSSTARGVLPGHAPKARILH